MKLVLWPEKLALTETEKTESSSLRGGESEPIWGKFNYNDHKSSKCCRVGSWIYSIQAKRKVRNGNRTQNVNRI